MIEVKPSGQACGATVVGLDLSGDLDATSVHAVRTAWMEHHVLAFPDQALSDADLERLVQYLGAFGAEPYFEKLIFEFARAFSCASLFACNLSNW